jgi:hypothetical protein
LKDWEKIVFEKGGKEVLDFMRLRRKLEEGWRVIGFLDEMPGLEAIIT